MTAVSVWRTNESHLSARAVADRFAAEFWDGWPRKVAEWRNGQFRLVDGAAWYTVLSIDGGWEVLRAD